MTSESENSLSIHPESSSNFEELTKIEEEAPIAPEIKTEEEANTIIYDEPVVVLTDMKQTSDTDIESELVNPQPLFEQPIVVEGKRSRKPTTRLEASDLTPSKKELSIPQGHGTPLGKIEYINHQITHASTDALSRMRTICFGRRGNPATIRKHLREFKGFEFTPDSDDYQKNLKNLIKLKKDQLRSISIILGVSSTGRNTDHAERILNFLVKPLDEGKRVPGKNSLRRASKKRSTDSKESLDINQNEKDKRGSDYIYKPGKKSSNKRSADSQNSMDAKRTKDESHIVNVTTSDSDKPIESSVADMI